MTVPCSLADSTIYRENYVVTIVVLIVVSMRKKKENQPPAHLGLAYFREER